jgi:hypothetical protein
MLSRAEYERLIYTLPTRYPFIHFSTLVLAPPGLDIAQLTGLVALGDDCVLCVYELLDFQPHIKRHRLAAPELGFSRPNLPFLIKEIEQEVLGSR